MRFFEIGFDNCGSEALSRLFHASNVKTLCDNGRYWRLMGHPLVSTNNVQLLIHRNIEAGRRAIEGLEEFHAFFGMEFVQNGWHIENYRHFAAIAQDYPRAKFLLNTRDTDDWLRARTRREGGLFLERAMANTGMSRKGVLNLWADDFHRHHEMVRDFFRDQPSRLLEFDIDRTPVKALVRFVRPDMRIAPRHWRSDLATAA